MEFRKEGTPGQKILFGGTRGKGETQCTKAASLTYDLITAREKETHTKTR